MAEGDDSSDDASVKLLEGDNGFSFNLLSSNPEIVAGTFACARNNIFGTLADVTCTLAP